MCSQVEQRSRSDAVSSRFVPQTTPNGGSSPVLRPQTSGRLIHLRNGGSPAQRCLSAVLSGPPRSSRSSWSTAAAWRSRHQGATIVGPEAGNLIHELVVAAAGGLTIDQVSQAIHIHPTLAEGVNAAAGGVHSPTSDDQ